MTKINYNLDYGSDTSELSQDQKSMGSRFSIDLLGDLPKELTSQLVDTGFGSLKDIVIIGPHELSVKSGISREESLSVYNQAISFFESIGIVEKRFERAGVLFDKRKKLGKVSTGSRNFDTLLGGGLEVNAITELYGEFGTGKTQLCHTACVMVQLDKTSGGLNGGALYIDTENTFRPERIDSISSSRNQNSSFILDHITVAKAYSTSHLELIISESSKIIDTLNIKLIVLDSAIALYRSEFLGLSTLSIRQQRLNKLIHTLMRIAQTHQIAVLVTNQVQSAPDTGFGNISFKAAGGNIFAHSSTYRIFLRKSNRNRIARMVDSPNHPESEIVFSVGEAGVIDPT